MTLEGPPERIGRYHILERVGKGGMGVLYRAFNPTLDREVAIKLTIADFTRDSDQMRPRFYREARAAAKLNHRNIVTIFEFAEESNVPYIVMELLHGMPLGVRMSVSPRLTLDDKLHIVSQLCDGLAYAHAQGVVHRDVKPDNIFVTEDGTVKLLDFGIAKLNASNLTVEGDMLGSASYMAPEQVSQSDAVDGRADVFSAGVVLYELLTGHRPFEADSPTGVILKILHHPPTPMDAYVTGLPLALCASVEKALEKDPANRFATADLLSRELHAIRRALEQQSHSPEFDDTRFADTVLLKKLSDDRQRLLDAQRATAPVAVPSVEARPSASAPQAPPAPRTPAPPWRPEPAPIEPSVRAQRWLVPAVAAVALIVAAAYLSLSARQVTLPASAAAPSAGLVQTAPAGPSTPASAGGAGSTAPGPSTSQTTPNPDTSTPPPVAPPAPPAVPLVLVTLTGDYPFEVRDGRRLLSPAGSTHRLRIAVDRPLTVVAPKYSLQQTVHVEGSSASGFVWAAPGLGILEIRSTQETCEVLVDGQNQGYPTVTIGAIAAGTHRVDISCDDAVSPRETVTVTAGATKLVAIR